jgi:hypothetical protein
MYYKPNKIHRRNRRHLDFILPFLIIICVGVVLVLSVQLYFALTEEPLNDKVEVYMVDGSARFLPWGMSNWQNVYSGMNFLPGDSLRTSKEGTAVLKFFNGSYVRIAPDSEVILQEVNRDDVVDEILVLLNDGEVWVNSKKEIGKITEFNVRTKNLSIKNTGTVFDVLNDDSEAVRVMRGEVNVDVFVYENSEEVVVESIDIGIGQEIDLSAKKITALQQRKNISMLDAISDEFEESNWYQWNVSEDTNPTEYVSGEEVDNLPEIEVEQDEVEDDSDQEEPAADVVGEEVAEVEEELSAPEPEEDVVEEKPTQEELGEFSAPIVVSYSGSLSNEVTKSPVLVKGKVSGAYKVVVNDYVLNEFKPGDKEWIYFLNDKYGNLSPGLNEYEVYAENANGEKSEVVKFQVTYKKEGVLEPETVITSEP